MSEKSINHKLVSNNYAHHITEPNYWKVKFLNTSKSSKKAEALCVCYISTLNFIHEISGTKENSQL